MKRRLFSIFLALALCLSLLPAAAFAEGEDWVQPDFAFYTAPEASEETLIAENSWVCYYTLPTPGTVWLIVSEGFEWEPSELGVSDKKQLEWDGNTAKIVLSDPFDMDLDRYNLYAWSEDRDYKIIIEKNARCSAVNFEHDNGECVIGFIDRGSIADVHLTDMLGIPTAENGELVEWKQLEIGAIIRGESGESPADDVKFEVNSIKIRQLYGEDGAFSFSQHEVKLEAGTDKPTLYYREGVEAGALIMASLTITLPDGSEMQGTAEYAVALENYGLKFYTSSDLDDGSFVEMAARLNYYNIPEGAVWLHSDTPIDMESLQVTTFSSLAPVMETTLEWESVGEDNRTIKIKLLEPLTVVTDGSYLLSVKSSEGTAALTIHDGPTGMSVKLGDNEYIVGFVFDRAGQPAVNEGNNDSKFSIGGSTFGDPDPNGEREFFADATVGVGLKRRDASGVAYYTFSENCPISFEVTGFDIRYYNFGQETEGYEDTFSVTQNGDTFKIYNKVGYEAQAVLNAYVDVYADGVKIRSGVVSLGIQLHKDESAPEHWFYTRPENDTVEALNTFIQEVVDSLPDSKEELGNIWSITFCLKDDSYEGIIEIPNALPDICLEAYDRTTIIGSVDANGSDVTLRNFDFISPESNGETRAVYGGNTDVSNCTFQGYDVAVDMRENSGIYRCVFADNKVALRVNIPSTFNGATVSSAPRKNAFINNGTAIQILSLNERLSPYYFRITDNNFVNNDTDFDIQHPGTFYFYRNYYGRVKKNVDDMTSAEILAALEKGSKNIQSQPPTRRIAEHSETKLVTNPRWKDPVDLSGLPSLPTRSAGSGSAVPAVMSLTAAEEPLENYLTADWTLPTEIIVGEEGLEISAAAFAEASEVDRVISVVEIDAANETSTLLAEWNFGKAAYPDLTGSFDASVTVTEGENGAKTITLKADDDLLAKLQPTLTIPEASGGVEHNGEGVASSSENGSVSFKVSGGGTYEISEDNPEIAPEPDTPSNPGTPVEPEEPEASFIDVVNGAWYVDAVDYVVENGLMEGTSATTFEPDAQMTRAMFWTILARIDGETITGATWADDAREWAMANNVSDGTDPNGRITREQLVTMLWRYLGEPESTGTFAAFTDAGTVSDWADEAMAWAVSEGIIGGVTATTLVPNGSATRAQCATILMRNA